MTDADAGGRDCRVFLVDDHAVFRSGVRAELSRLRRVVGALRQVAVQQLHRAVQPGGVAVVGQVEELRVLERTSGPMSLQPQNLGHFHFKRHRTADKFENFVVHSIN